MKRQFQLEAALFLVLVAFGVFGRWWQPQWNVTPTAALALFAGYIFTHRRTAILVPLAILAISNLLLESYNHAGEMLAVYGSFLIPVAFSGLLRPRLTALRLFGCTVVPSVTFFLITNFAVWSYRRGDAYADSFAGLLDCYTAGLPFFRWMLMGDLCFAAMIFGAYSLGASTLFLRRAPARVPRDRT